MDIWRPWTHFCVHGRLRVNCRGDSQKTQQGSSEKTRWPSSPLMLNKETRENNTCCKLSEYYYVIPFMCMLLNTLIIAMAYFFSVFQYETSPMSHTQSVLKANAAVATSLRAQKNNTDMKFKSMRVVLVGELGNYMQNWQPR